MDPRYKSPAVPVEANEQDSFRSLSTLTTALVWMLRAGAIVAVLSLVSSWMQLELLSHPYTEAQGIENDQREGAIGGFSMVLAIATFVVFGIWIVRAHRNLPALGARHLEFTPGWALGWFFVPIAYFWKPYQAMRALWQNSRDATRPDIQDTTWILPVWWGLWIISLVLGNYLFRTSMRATTVEQLTVTTQVTLLNCLVDVFLYSVASMLVGKIWQFQLEQRNNPSAYSPAPGFADGAGG